MLTDPIADMLTRIRNALMRRHPFVEIPQSRIKQQIAELLQTEGFVQSVSIVSASPRPSIRIGLKYTSGEEPVIRGMERLSRPGQRIYQGHRDLKPVEGGIGIAILSTPKGLMTDRQSREQHIGGEVLCHIW